MNTLSNELREVTAERVVVTKDTLRVELADGRTVEAPLAWYPRLLHGTAKERARWRLIGSGEGIHWPIWTRISALKTFLRPSFGESQRSFKKWLEMRKKKAA